MDTNIESGGTPPSENSELNTNLKPLTMSAELKAGNATIVILGTLVNERDILPTLGSALNFLSKLKENLTLPHGSEWTISFAADQTYKLTSYSGTTTGQLEDIFRDTRSGVQREESERQLGLEFPKVG